MSEAAMFFSDYRQQHRLNVPAPVQADPPTEIDTELLKAGTSLVFSVVINAQGPNHFNLGQWTTAGGFDVTWDLVEYRAGDSGNYRWIFPGRPKYKNIKLTRFVTPRRHTDLRRWLESNSFASAKDTAAIKLFAAQVTGEGAGAAHELVAQWDLEGVMPISYTGPQLDASTGKLASETLELAHIGWLKSDTQFG